MKCQTQFTFVGAEMVAQQLGVFGEVDGFEGEGA
jgi:hypothetical protein